MSKIMVLPGGKWQVPLVKKIKEMGHIALVVSPELNPPCKALCDVFLQSDIFDIDYIEKFAKNNNIDAVLSDECDIAMPVIAELGNRLSLFTINRLDAELYTNKYMMREFCRANGFPTPEYEKCKTVDDAIKFMRKLGCDIIIKPLDSNASHGVFLVSDEDTLKKRFSESLFFSRYEKSVIVERYIKGTEFTVDGIKTAQNHYSLAVSEKKHYKHNCNIANELYFSHINNEFDYNALKRQNDLFVNKSGLLYGFTHAEYKYENGKFYLIEIAARGGGNLISGCIVQHMSGYDTYKYLIENALKINNLSQEFELNAQYINRVAVLKFFDTPNNGGFVKDIKGEEFLDNLNEIVDWNFRFKVGDYIEPAVNDSVRIGYYIACSENRNCLDKIIKTVDENVRILIDN